jgi:hypothetical protein
MLQQGALLLLGLTCRTGRAGKFWHITDLHLDRDYVVGGNVKDMCHRYLTVLAVIKLSISGVFFSHVFFLVLSVRFRPCWVKVEPSCLSHDISREKICSPAKRGIY